MRLMHRLTMLAVLGICLVAAACSTAKVDPTGVQIPRDQLVQFQQSLDAAQTVPGIPVDRAAKIKTVDAWLTAKLASDTSDPVTITLADALMLYAEWKGGTLPAPTPPPAS